ncbi:MAG TPA: pentapeptide repeat-containing protein, partial [Methylobacter sp.]
MKVHFYGLGLLAALFCLSVSAAELSRASVQQRLAKAEQGHPAQLRRKDLTGLDLSGLDFRNADLWGSDLRNANF